jgi:2-keto-4-pentenoate hydratase
MMDEAAIQKAAKVLRDVRLTRQRINALPEDCKPADIDDGYRIQGALLALLGLDVFGWKIGSTNRAAQQLVGTTEPFGARLLTPHVPESPAQIPGDACFIRALEPEFAFRLGVDLPPARTPYARDDVIAAVDSLHPAIEISDTRYNDWSKVGAPSLVADNGSEGRFVLGKGVAEWRDLDLSAHRVSLSVNARVVAEGSGANVLGDPVDALLWLANDRARRGDGLEAGQVITTGSCTGVVMGEPGDRASADFGTLGTVELSFLPDDRVGGCL